MELICHDCWNYTYFSCDVETLRELKVTPEHALIQDAMFEHWNYSESMFRDNLLDIVQYVLKEDAGALRWDHESGCYVNNYIHCAQCGSKKVTKPYSPWHHHHLSLEQELQANRKEYSQLRKEKRNGHYLPILWSK